jgi:hypothetical protein
LVGTPRNSEFGICPKCSKFSRSRNSEFFEISNVFGTSVNNFLNNRSEKYFIAAKFWKFPIGPSLGSNKSKLTSVKCGMWISECPKVRWESEKRPKLARRGRKARQARRERWGGGRERRERRERREEGKREQFKTYYNK